MTTPIRYLSVCSGMEAASVAWEPLGFKAVGFSEIEPFPCAILKHRFPNIPNHGSLTEHHTWPIEPGSIDLLVGGTPCQSFSVAGLRKGLADPRGNLALTFLALADRLKPRWIVWENVPGVLSSSGGRDFGSFLGALGQLGYGWAYRVLDAQHFGVPQRRRRVFVVACLGDWRAPAEVLSLREGLLGYLEKGKQKRKGAAADAPGGVDAGGPWWDGSDRASTLTKKGAGGQQRMPDKGNFEAVVETKPIVIDRAAFNQGENAQYEPHIEASETMDPLVSRGPHADGVSSSIPFRKSKRAQTATDDESWVADGKANTLNNFDLGDTRTTHAVVEPVHQMPGSVAPTIGASGPPYSRTGNERVEADALAITFQPGNLRRDAGADPSTDATTTQIFSQGGGGLVPAPIISPTVTTCKGSRGGCSQEAIDEITSIHKAQQQGDPVAFMAVRRLTPVECERLQGFPDNWSRIPWKGKPEEQCPDGPRYKACGNSMAVPVMRWIGERIKAVEEQSK